MVSIKAGGLRCEWHERPASLRALPEGICRAEVQRQHRLERAPPRRGCPRGAHGPGGPSVSRAGRWWRQGERPGSRRRGRAGGEPPRRGNGRSCSQRGDATVPTSRARPGRCTARRSRTKALRLAGGTRAGRLSGWLFATREGLHNVNTILLPLPPLVNKPRALRRCRAPQAVAPSAGRWAATSALSCRRSPVAPIIPKGSRLIPGVPPIRSVPKGTRGKTSSGVQFGIGPSGEERHSHCV